MRGESPNSLEQNQRVVSVDDKQQKTRKRIEAAFIELGDSREFDCGAFTINCRPAADMDANLHADKRN